MRVWIRQVCWQTPCRRILHCLAIHPAGAQFAKSAFPLMGNLLPD
jgi:hypothetical protein